MSVERKLRCRGKAARVTTTATATTTRATTAKIVVEKTRAFTATFEKKGEPQTTTARMHAAKTGVASLEQRSPGPFPPPPPHHPVPARPGTSCFPPAGLRLPFSFFLLFFILVSSPRAPFRLADPHSLRSPLPFQQTANNPAAPLLPSLALPPTALPIAFRSPPLPSRSAPSHSPSPRTKWRRRRRRRRSRDLGRGRRCPSALFFPPVPRWTGTPPMTSCAMVLLPRGKLCRDPGCRPNFTWRPSAPLVPVDCAYLWQEKKHAAGDPQQYSTRASTHAFQFS